jgi:hypothetical protein
MEPNLPTPSRGPERSPNNYDPKIEHIPFIPTPETGLERGHEQFEQRSEAAPVAVTATPILPPPVIAPLPTPVVSDDSHLTTDDDTPATAADEDLIEKEWVDKAKRIILQTKDDPYRREQEVSKLQADYLRKRYGRELGASQ